MLLLRYKIMKYGFLLIVFTIFLTSCTTYFSPVMSGGNNIGYLPRPTFNDSIKTEKYISGEYHYSEDNSGNLQFHIGEINISKGHTYKIYNYGYGAFGYMGVAGFEKPTENNSANTIDNFTMFVYGGGITTTIGLQTVSQNGNFNFRFLNWENAFSIERGEFSKFRKELYEITTSSGNGNFYVSNLTNLYTTGLSTECIFIQNNRKKTQIGIRLFLGYTPNLTQNFRNLNGTAAYSNSEPAFIISSYIRNKKSFATLQIGGEINTSLKIGVGHIF